MALTRTQKEAQVADLTKKFKEAQSVMFAHCTGMTVDEVSELRRNLREAEAEMKVAKKTLVRIALKEAGLPEVSDEVIEGPVSFIFSFSDALSGAQVAFKFSKDHHQVQLIGGIYEGSVLTEDEAMELAKMPSREVLLATFMSMLLSPLTSFAALCSSPLSGFARAVNEIAEKGGFGAESKVFSEPEPEKSEEPAS